MRSTDPTGKVCPCGKPALKHEGNGFVCASCDEIERRMNRTNFAPRFNGQKDKRLFMPVHACCYEPRT